MTCSLRVIDRNYVVVNGHWVMSVLFEKHKAWSVEFKVYSIDENSK